MLVNDHLGATAGIIHVERLPRLIVLPPKEAVVEELQRQAQVVPLPQRGPRVGAPVLEDPAQAHHLGVPRLAPQHALDLGAPRVKRVSSRLLRVQPQILNNQEPGGKKAQVTGEIGLYSQSNGGGHSSVFLRT